MPTGVLDYTPPRSVNYNTIPSLSPSGNSTHMSEGDAHRAMLEVGMHITVRPGCGPTVTGLTGLIVTVGGTKEGDCTVLLDGWDHPLDFFWHEIVISKTPKPATRLLLPRTALSG